MSYKTFISKRFLFSKGESNFISFITLISIIGVAIGVTVLIISVSILNGFEKEITLKTTSLSSHIQVNSFKPEGIRDYKYVVGQLMDTSNHLGIVSIHPYAQHEAVIKYKDNTEGIILKGIRDEDSIFSSQRKIISGSTVLGSTDTTVIPVIIGSKLASKLGINVDNKVFIIATQGIPSAMNQPTVKACKVVGIYESSMKDFDDVLLYANLGSVQRLFSMGNNVTGIEIMVKDINNIQETSNRIKQILGYPFYSRSIYQIYKGLFTWVELQRNLIPLVLGLIILVAAFNIIGFLLMIVLEKTEEIGILKSLGSNSKDIIHIFFNQGMLITIAGIILGNILGYGLCLLQLKFDLVKVPDIYYVTSVPISISWGAGLWITGITLLICIFITIVPSYLASKLSPITSLRFK